MLICKGICRMLHLVYYTRASIPRCFLHFPFAPSISRASFSRCSLHLPETPSGLLQTGIGKCKAGRITNRHRQQQGRQVQCWSITHGHHFISFFRFSNARGPNLQCKGGKCKGGKCKGVFKTTLLFFVFLL